jgi:hypothetical protein
VSRRCADSCEGVVNLLVYRMARHPGSLNASKLLVYKRRQSFPEVPARVVPYGPPPSRCGASLRLGA